MTIYSKKIGHQIISINNVLDTMLSKFLGGQMICSNNFRHNVLNNVEFIWIIQITGGIIMNILKGYYFLGFGDLLIYKNEFCSQCTKKSADSKYLV